MRLLQSSLRCNQSAFCSSAASPATQRCISVQSASRCRRLGSASHGSIACFLVQHRSIASGGGLRCHQKGSPVRCQQEDSTAEAHEAASPIEPEVLPPEASTSGAAEDMQASSTKQRWSLASWMLGRGGDSGVGMGTALLAAAGASSAGFLGSSLDFSGPQSIATAVGVLAAIIAIHEAGHFAAARAQGIHVTKFAIGFGPAVLSYQGKEVEYSLRAIPLGGYVAFPDDDPESKYAPDDPDLLRNRSIAQRALVISAGVIANVIFAFSLLLTQVSTVGVAESQLRPGVLVPEVSRGAPAAAAGVRAGDIILKIGNMELSGNPAAVQRAVRYILDHPEKRLDLTVVRDRQLIHIPVTPSLAADGGGRIGVTLASNASVVRRAAKGAGQALRMASAEFGRLASIVTGGLQQVVFNFEKTKDSLSGPVAIVAVGAEVARSDVAGLFQFAAILNINLAIINILPLPALDGGYLALLLAEAIRGKKLPTGLEQGIMASGFLLITGVGLLLVLRDTLNLTLGNTGLL